MVKEVIKTKRKLLMQPDNNFITYTAKLSLSDKEKSYCDDYIKIYNKKLHKYAEAQTKGCCNSRKEYHNYIGGDIPYRVMYAIEQHYKGIVDSQKSNAKNYIINVNKKIKKIKSIIDKLQNELLYLSDIKTRDKLKKIKKNIYLKKQVLVRQQNKLKYLEQDNNKKICFGGKKLFLQRHNAKTIKEINEWKSKWYKARFNEIRSIGSHDENQGNSNFQLSKSSNGSYSLSICVPKALQNKYNDKRIQINNIIISNDKYNFINYALEQNSLRKNDNSIKGSPISFNIKNKNNNWYLSITVRKYKINTVTNIKNGAIGIDINADHLAIIETDYNGNYINSFTEKTYLTGKSTNQAKAIIGDAVKRIVEYALKTKKNIIIEDLDFKKKKDDLYKANPKYARMLSSFAYKKVIDNIKSKCYKLGVMYQSVDPRYTSKIGALKYKKRYGLTTHHSAALVIARRGHGFIDIPIKKIIHVENSEIYNYKPPVRKGLKLNKYYYNFFIWYKGLLHKVVRGLRLSCLKKQIRLDNTISSTTTEYLFKYSPNPSL